MSSLLYSEHSTSFYHTISIILVPVICSFEATAIYISKASPSQVIRGQILEVWIPDKPQKPGPSGP